MDTMSDGIKVARVWHVPHNMTPSGETMWATNADDYYTIISSGVTLPAPDDEGEILWRGQPNDVVYYRSLSISPVAYREYWYSGNKRWGTADMIVDGKRPRGTLRGQMLALWYGSTTDATQVAYPIIVDVTGYQPRYMREGLQGVTRQLLLAWHDAVSNGVITRDTPRVKPQHVLLRLGFASKIWSGGRKQSAQGIHPITVAVIDNGVRVPDIALRTARDLYRLSLNWQHEYSQRHSVL